METRTASFQVAKSALVDAFAHRSQTAYGSPYEAMANHVRKLRTAAGGSVVAMHIFRCLGIRNVRDIALDTDTSGDGYIQPIGSTYDKGFGLVLSKQAPCTRRLFTVAHEICHTFFYELVPEIKFFPHQPDEEEERLCNFGAAQLLMPSSEYQVFAARFEPSLAALNHIAEHFGVSAAAALIRLRALRLWNCTLSFWYMRTNGAFNLERIYGGSPDWKWADELGLQKAWESRGLAEISGRATVTRTDATKGSYETRIFFQAKRVRELVAVLWSPDPLKNSCCQYALFLDQAFLPYECLCAQSRAVV